VEEEEERALSLHWLWQFEIARLQSSKVPGKVFVWVCVFTNCLYVCVQIKRQALWQKECYKLVCRCFFSHNFLYKYIWLYVHAFICPFSFLRINLRWFQLYEANNNWHKCLAREGRPNEIFKTVWHVFRALFIGSEMCYSDVWQLLSIAAQTVFHVLRSVFSTFEKRLKQP